ncbi:MAG: amidohydrolase family protein [Candidatus Longimicrobiales bacterium M2_2A_002]
MTRCRSTLRIAPLLLLGALVAPPLEAQERPPILDMHLHAMPADAQGPPPLAMCTPIGQLPAWDPRQPWPETFIGMLKQPTCDDPVWSPTTDAEVMTRTLDVMERLNVVGVVSGPPPVQERWMKAAPERFIPGLVLDVGRPDAPSVEEVRRLYERGDIAVIGEVINQYSGVEPTDERMEPYWALAEELDIPVGIHIGLGPPGSPYLGFENYRARMHSPLGIEEVLVRHPGLRVYIMHAGYPHLEDLLSLMYAHPQVYVDVGVIVYTQPRAAFYRFLKGITDASFTNRVLFGTDQMVWPETIERAVAVIREAPFLDEAQKRAILYDNAARFLRMGDEERARHRRMGDAAPAGG